MHCALSRWLPRQARAAFLGSTVRCAWGWSLEGSQVPRGWRAPSEGADSESAGRFRTVGRAWGAWNAAAGASWGSGRRARALVTNLARRGWGTGVLCPPLVQEFLFVFLGKSSLEPRTGSHLERMQPAVQSGDVSAGVFGKQRELGGSEGGGPATLKDLSRPRTTLPSSPDVYSVCRGSEPPQIEAGRDPWPV